VLYFNRMASSTKDLLSIREYLALDRSSPVRNEYFEGEIFAMTGASRRHNLISLHLAGDLDRQLTDRDCEVYASEMRQSCGHRSLHLSDIVVVCGDPVFEDNELDTLVNPNLIIEVLSKSTEGYDRGAKFEFYRALSSLKQVLLIAQDKVHIESYLRLADRTWLFSETDDLSSSVTLPSISCNFTIANVYHKIRFD
jgi:Uma2 family endonuclease